MIYALVYAVGGTHAVAGVSVVVVSLLLLVFLLLP
jgi:hypothetical protein